MHDEVPNTTNIVAVTYDEAMKLYVENGRHPFSFLAAPYGVLKTIQVQRGVVVAVPPQSVGESK